MSKYNENIYDSSIWITATPTPTAEGLPFYATESGHFTAYTGYSVSRDLHESFLLIYTVKGSGRLRSAGNETVLTPSRCAVIDCRKPHMYEIIADEWEFYWIHFNGIGAAPMENIYASYGLRAAEVEDTVTFERIIKRIMGCMRVNDVVSSMQISSDIHRLFLVINKAASDASASEHRREYAAEIDIVTDYIKDNYSKNITIDDMLDRVHMSRYHFIRVFKRIMGTTPYSYLTSYRINMSKRMLRLTDRSIAEIAEDCGFLDTSNFITHFKKHIGIKPMQYRKDHI
ncbi:MAG: AraC family transcriptional regulator [Clostridia bacterium]|nr:AraC family transcriptional regulator [Clostridia bacterium]